MFIKLIKLVSYAGLIAVTRIRRLSPCHQTGFDDANVIVKTAATIVNYFIIQIVAIEIFNRFADSKPYYSSLIFIISDLEITSTYFQFTKDNI